MTPVKTLSMAVSLALALALLTANGAEPTSKPASQPASSKAEIFQAWPFDAKEAARRQDETAKALGSQKELVLDLGKGATMKLLLIPAGKFVMGSPKDEKVRRDNETQHEVAIGKPFYMGIYHVTQEQYTQVMGTNPSQFKGATDPVEFVSWNDAVEFCKQLSQKTGKAVTLPTEAQWEYACRAGTTTLFNTGETISADQANCDGKYVHGNGQQGKNRQASVAVGSFPPNAYGLYDMHGNVWQWCADWYDKDYYANSPKADPTGPATGTCRVLRGGSWGLGPWDCRSAYRDWYNPGCFGSLIGFRVAVWPD